jgi:uncharacterized OB-fold protein
VKAPAAFQPHRLHRRDWYVERGGDWHLRASRCRGCDRLAFPPTRVCPRCWPRGTEEALLPERGSLLTWSRVEVGPPAFDAQYLIGYVDVAPGVRLFGQVDTRDETALTLGDEVSLELGVIRQEPEGPVWGYRFACERRDR